MNVRRSLAASVLVLAVPLLSSCASSFGVQTDKIYNPAEGVNNRTGSVDVLNALVVSAADGSGTVIASLSNENQKDADELTGIAGTGKDASLKITPGGSTTIPAGGLLNLATAGKIFASGSPIKAGLSVRLTFSFQRGQSATLDVPVVASTEPEYSSVPLPPTS